MHGIHEHLHTRVSDCGAAIGSQLKFVQFSRRNVDTEKKGPTKKTFPTTFSVFMEVFSVDSSTVP